MPSIGRRVLALFVLALAASAWHPARADGYPAKTVRIVVPFAPGGGTDVIARILGQKLSVLLGQQFIVENKSGAGGSIGTDQVAKAAPDGYTLLLAPTSHVINPSIFARLPFDTERDFAPITMVASTPILVAVPAKVPVTNLKELVALAHANPQAIGNYGSAGNGTVFHLATELFKRKNGIDPAHIPYKGGGPVVMALVSGEVQMAFETMLSLQPFVRSGRVRALAVASHKRSPLMPEVPTAEEQGFPELVATNDYMLFAPAATPKPVLDTLYEALMKVLAEPDTAANLAAQGADVVAGTPQQLAAYVHAERARWAEVVKIANVRSD
ncbi:MAG: tripartite tricarboxylate transporter substrate binding protein [Usitatibacter sp.]